MKWNVASASNSLKKINLQESIIAKGQEGITPSLRNGITAGKQEEY